MPGPSTVARRQSQHRETAAVQCARHRNRSPGRRVRRNRCRSQRRRHPPGTRPHSRWRWSTRSSSACRKAARWKFISSSSRSSSPSAARWPPWAADSCSLGFAVLVFAALDGRHRNGGRQESSFRPGQSSCWRCWRSFFCCKRCRCSIPKTKHRQAGRNHRAQLATSLATRADPSTDFADQAKVSASAGRWMNATTSAPIAPQAALPRPLRITTCPHAPTNLARLRQCAGRRRDRRTQRRPSAASRRRRRLRRRLRTCAGFRLWLRLRRQLPMRQRLLLRRLRE